MSKIKKFYIGIILIIVTILSSLITEKIVWNQAYLKYNPLIDSHFASVVYAFSENKETQLLKTSSNIVVNNMLYINEHTDVNLKNYSYLCVYLNEEFRNTLLYHSRENKENISSAYSKINEFCKTEI